MFGKRLLVLPEDRRVFGDLAHVLLYECDVTLVDVVVRFVIFQEHPVKRVQYVHVQVAHVTDGNAGERNRSRHYLHCDLLRVREEPKMRIK